MVEGQTLVGAGVKYSDRTRKACGVGGINNKDPGPLEWLQVGEACDFRPVMQPPGPQFLLLSKSGEWMLLSNKQSQPTP